MTHLGVDLSEMTGASLLTARRALGLRQEDLGPTRSKKAWATLGVDGMGVWDEAPPSDFVGTPRLTTRIAARVQGFPDDWAFSGRKTAAYRQIGNAFPPPVATAVASQIAAALKARRKVFRVA